MEDFGANYITITDEEGRDIELEVLSTVTYRGAEYLAVTLADADEDAEELEVDILKSATGEDGEPVLDIVEDEEELEAVYDLLMENMMDEDEE